MKKKNIGYHEKSARRVLKRQKKLKPRQSKRRETNERGASVVKGDRTERLKERQFRRRSRDLTLGKRCPKKKRIREPAVGRQEKPVADTTHRGNRKRTGI